LVIIHQSIKGFLRKDYNKDLITFIGVIWALCGFGRKRIKRMRRRLGRRIMILVWSGL
jgi:hypothetical protein